MRIVLLATLFVLPATNVHAEDAVFRAAATVLEQRCVRCHQVGADQGDLTLSTAKGLLAGGESGEAISPGDADGSLLLDYVIGESPEMPKQGAPLKQAEIAALRKWIDAGAKWPKGVTLQDRSDVQLADLNWWSLKKLKRPAVPILPAELRQRARTPVDAFVLKQLAARDLQMSPPADRRTLLRRLTFDLTGLPPTPAEVSSFVTDKRPDAYARLVERLLASPAYGERWARHWLDVAHYADTHGYDKDKLRRNAWPYRDYVIRAMNQDRAYGRFIRQQIAGDILEPHTRDGVTATGFLAAGPWDFIGHVEVPESKIDGRIARHLDRDDMVSSTMAAFTSTTAGCARCHNHKFDPVSQRDYYRLQAVFAAIDRADRTYEPSPTTGARRQQLLALQSRQQQELEQSEQQLQVAGGAELAALNAQIHKLTQQKNGKKHRPEFGYHSQIERKADVAKWVQVDLGRAVSLKQIVLAGCHDNYNNIGAGFGFPPRYKIEGSNDPLFNEAVQTIADRTTASHPNPGVKPQVFATDITVRHIRVTATQLAPRSNDFIFALGELMALDADGNNAALGKTVTSLDSIQAPVRWQRKNVVDGYYYGQKNDAAGVAQLASLHKKREALIQQAAPELLTKIESLKQQLRETASQLKTLPAPGKVYAGHAYTGSGNFKGTGGKPREIRLLKRGNIQTPGEIVQPGTLRLDGGDGGFELPADHTEGERRVALAQWISDHGNPLTWRSMVNRVWQYHFGRGIVGSPDDFGRMGQQPTHPQLLDWLAVELRDNGESLKHLHRLIVNSAVYRQSSAENAAAASIDSGNQFLWRMNRRRLEAEAVRDAALAVSGALNRQMYGEGFWTFVLEKPQHSPHYQYHKFDAHDAKSHRRSVYRFIVRSQPDPYMQTLDCADPSQVTGRRTQTLTPLHALTLLNDKFMLTMAEQFAQRVKADSAGQSIREAFTLALNRPPRPAELAALTEYCQSHGLANTCRVILNLNEFIFID